MRRSLATAAAVLLLAAASGSASAADPPSLEGVKLQPLVGKPGAFRPPAPDGFDWKAIEPIHASVLVPAGWHFREGTPGESLGFFVTKEAVDDPVQAHTGLSINVMRKPGGTDAVARARALVKSMTESGEVLGLWSAEDGAFKGVECLARMTGDDGAKTNMRLLAIGNESTNTLYVLWFESPTDQWDAAWKSGEPMMRLIQLDDTY